LLGKKLIAVLRPSIDSADEAVAVDALAACVGNVYSSRQQSIERALFAPDLDDPAAAA
jgi:hypothetical protein